MLIENNRIIDIVARSSNYTELYKNDIYFHNVVSILRQSSILDEQILIQLIAFVCKLNFDTMAKLQEYVKRYGIIE
jgi:hypothetical protein